MTTNMEELTKLKNFDLCENLEASLDEIWFLLSGCIHREDERHAVAAFKEAKDIVTILKERSTI